MGEVNKDGTSLVVIIVVLIVGLVMGAGIGYFLSPPELIKTEYRNITEADFFIVKEIPRDLVDVKVVEDDDLIVFIWFDDYGGIYGRYKMCIVEVK